MQHFFQGVVITGMLLVGIPFLMMLFIGVVQEMRLLEFGPALQFTTLLVVLGIGGLFGMLVL